MGKGNGLAIILLWFAMSMPVGLLAQQENLPTLKNESKKGYKNYFKRLNKSVQQFNKTASLPQQKGAPKPNSIDLAFKLDLLKTHDPSDGKIHPERLYQLITSPSVQNKNTNPMPVAPGQQANNQWKERGPSNVAGRVRSAFFDPNDPTGKRAFAGGVGGGLWVNNDITNPDSTWKKLSNFWSSISVSAICYDPDSSHIFYAATGEYGHMGIQGMGMWRSIDAGSSWHHLPASNTKLFESIYDVQVDSNSNLFVATQSGLFKSTDFGASFKQLRSGPHRDIEIGANGDLYATAYYGAGQNKYSGKIYKSKNAGTSFTEITPKTGDPFYIELAVAPSDSNVLYAVASTNYTRWLDIEWLMYSNDQGKTWQHRIIPTLPANPTDHFTRDQAWYNLVLKVHQTDPNIVYAGGIDLHRSVNGGLSWKPMSSWFNWQNLEIVHADQHEIVQHPMFANRFMFGNDGGMYYSANAGDTSVSAKIESRNKQLNITQYYHLAVHPAAGSNHIIGGTQDNGTIYLNNANQDSGKFIGGGDGCFCSIDQNEGDIWIHSSQNGSYIFSTDTGKTFRYLHQTIGASFINPSCYDSDFNILYANQRGGRIEVIDSLYATKRVRRIQLTGNNLWYFTTLEISPHNPQTSTVFAAISGQIYRVDSAHSANPKITKLTSKPLAAGWISDIAVGRNDNELVVTFSNYGITSVFYTSNGGQTWENKEGNLPDLPIRAALINPKNPSEVILGSELGVWATSNFNAQNPYWIRSNSGLANTRIDEFKYRKSDSTVFVATHGRGIFSGRFSSTLTASPVANFSASVDTVCVGEQVIYRNTSLFKPTAFNWSVKDSAWQNYSGDSIVLSYKTSGLKEVVLTVSNSSGQDSVNKKLVWVAPQTGAKLLALDSVCVSDSSLKLTQGIPAGGSYFGLPVVNQTINPSKLGVGTHNISYQVSNGYCTDTVSRQFTINALPVLSWSGKYQFCEYDAPIVPNFKPVGGQFYGNAISNNRFNPAQLGQGSFTAKYHFTDSNSCSNTLKQAIEIYPTPSIDSIYGNKLVAENSVSNYQVVHRKGNNYQWKVIGGQILQTDSGKIKVQWNKAGVGKIELVVDNQFACADSSNTTVTIEKPSGGQVYLNGQKIQVFPNPIHDEINFRSLGYSGQFAFKILNQSGQTVYKHSGVLLSEGEQLSVPLNLSSGQYFLMLESKNESLTLPIIKH